MPPGQHDAAMIYFGLCARLGGFRQNLPLYQCATASRAPVRLCLLGEHCVALATDPFHVYEITGLGLGATSASVYLSIAR
jgi:hypothetical protein